MKPIGPTILLSVSTVTASVSLTSVQSVPIQAVAATNLTSGVVTYATVSLTSATVTAPTTTVAQNLVPVLGLTQDRLELQSTQTSTTVWVNAIASAAGTLALTPLF